MKLPYRNKAFIPEQKLSHYILSQTHPVGRFKAKFFRGLGFDEHNMHLLEASLIKIARSEEVVEVLDSPFGTIYIIDGKISMGKNKLQLERYGLLKRLKKKLAL